MRRSPLSTLTPGIEQVIDVNGGVRTGGMMAYATNYVQDGAASNSTSNAKYSSRLR